MPPVKEPAPAIPAWDSMLYWFHGFLTCSVVEIVITNVLLDNESKVIFIRSSVV